MSGELRLSQFRWTTTANDDLVIGNPAEAGLHNTKFIVFQATNTPGYAANPHFRCEWNGSAWAFKMNQGGGGGDLALTGMAYLADGTLGTPQTFTGYNTFSGPVIASSTVNLSNNVTLGTTSGNTLTVHSAAQFNNNLTVAGNLTINGTLTNVNTTNLEVTDKLITLNNGGGVASGGGSGIEIEESGAITGYIKIASDRIGWDLKSPVIPGATRFRQSLTQVTDIDLLLPEVAGTLALLSDITTAVSMTANRAVLSNGTGTGLTPSAVTNTELGYLSGVTSAIQDQFTGKATDSTVVHLSGPETITGNKNFESVLTLSSLYVGVSATYTGSVSFATSKTGDATVGGIAGISLSYDSGSGNTTFASSYAAYHSTIATQGFFLGVSGIGSATNGMTLTRNETTNKVLLEVLCDMGSGSGLVLKDRTTGTRYELYVNSGVLNIALA
jgi:hypothetical protein